jgi:hypothetical protein
LWFNHLVNSDINKKIGIAFFPIMLKTRPPITLPYKVELSGLYVIARTAYIVVI